MLMPPLLCGETAPGIARRPVRSVVVEPSGEGGVNGDRYEDTIGSRIVANIGLSRATGRSEVMRTRGKAFVREERWYPGECDDG